MMASILNSAILDSAILNKTLTQTNSIWLKLLNSHSTWWWQPSWIWQSWIQPFCTKKKHLSFILTQLDDGSHLEFCQLEFHILDSAILVFSLKHTHTCQHWFPLFQKKTSLIHSDSTWWWQPSCNMSCWIQTLPSWIQTPCYHLSDSLKNTLTPIWLCLKLIQSDSNSFILT